MGDPLQDRTRRLLTDYILFCARAPNTPEPLPTSVEAALLRSVTSQIQQEHQDLFNSFRDYQGNRLELVTQMADELLSNDQEFNWGRLVMLLAFVGTLMNQDRTVKRRRDQRNRLLLERDCYLIVSLLYNRLTGRHRSWLEAHGGWDGFCQFFKNPLPPGFWRRLLIRAILSCFFATAIFYIWKCL
ncbi:Bcl2-like 10 [Rattus norvegicus]|uniref:Bcl-2-like protein 10 n=2 Tax=Rattus norvegicus TaxID=10116 RepID=B2L10_RAT|nr:bcl-2-like protein 10 [Rattus norvegicus]Q99M66.1 RecName: Full=Bcl-2-like protein 10; Short=Bcl2-L-10; AltName: Full=Anti-apoptotic protein Boo; AltName: Full=Apoptosis regulator Bcl-B [Rattus norvegicus]AAK31792.1 BCL2L10 [Rattus norvegicus]EDL77801.1 Bcl2-like 10 [Rattus norvegicus]|eukprot:NP_446185.1 bcl-2-like protein 10 [Rattus norvegicus]